MTEELGKPLRVLAFSDVALPEGSGGEERQIEEIYGRWVESSRAEVLLVALGGEGLPQHDRRRGIRIVRAPQLRLGRLTGAQAALSTAVWPLAFRATRAFRPHVIHANTLFHATSSAALVAAWRHRTPFVITAHIGSLDALPQPYRFMAKAYEQSVGRVLVRRADRVICVGNEVRDHIRGLGADDARLAVVPNGVDSSRFHPPTKARRRDDTVVIATIGRLIFNKGHHLVIEAVRQLVRDGARLRLLVVGDGPMRKKLQSTAADLEGEGVVEFLGHREDVESILRRCDIFVRASFTESIPMGVLEAMATGLPVIATDVGGVRELLDDGRNGLLIPPDEDSVRVALARLIADRPLRERIGREARTLAVRFDWDRCATSTFAVVHDAAMAGAGGRDAAVDRS